MSEILFQYHKMHPTTWVYLASLLMIGLYFKFGRFWSVRNLDLVLLILLAPGLLMAQYGGEARLNAIRLATQEVEPSPTAPPTSAPAATTDSPLGVLPVDEPSDVVELPPAPEDSTTIETPADEREPPGSAEAEDALDLQVTPPPPPVVEADVSTAAPQEAELTGREVALQRVLRSSRDIELGGFLWLLAVGVLFVIRLLVDTTMVRRPLLEPNLTAGGLFFFCCSLFVFLMANVITSRPYQGIGDDAASVEEIAAGAAAEQSEGQPIPRGPGYALLNLLPSIPTNPMVPGGVRGHNAGTAYTVVGKTIAISCHLIVVLGILAIGYWHFGNMKTGVGVSALYLMLPYTAQMTGQIDHVVPASLLVWAVLCYRQPLFSGILLGLASALVYYPLFLLPLWISFYWRRGAIRFGIGVGSAVLLMAILLVAIPDTSYWENFKQMFGLWLPKQKNLEGLWGLNFINPVYRVPILAAYVALSGTLALWPAHKNLGTLLSCSAALMVAAQFWHGFGGGLYMCWYLPLALLTFFRPNLEDRVAISVLGEGWKPRRVGTSPAVG